MFSRSSKTEILNKTSLLLMCQKITLNIVKVYKEKNNCEAGTKRVCKMKSTIFLGSTTAFNVKGELINMTRAWELYKAKVGKNFVSKTVHMRIPYALYNLSLRTSSKAIMPISRRLLILRK